MGREERTDHFIHFYMYAGPDEAMGPIYSYTCTYMPWHDILHPKVYDNMWTLSANTFKILESCTFYCLGAPLITTMLVDSLKTASPRKLLLETYFK